MPLLRCFETMQGVPAIRASATTLGVPSEWEARKAKRDCSYSSLIRRSLKGNVPNAGCDEQMNDKRVSSSLVKSLLGSSKKVRSSPSSPEQFVLFPAALEPPGIRDPENRLEVRPPLHQRLDGQQCVADPFDLRGAGDNAKIEPLGRAPSADWAARNEIDA